MPTHDANIRVLSQAVQAWYRYYDVEPDETASHALCLAAIEFYNDGYRTLDDLSTVLIGTYVGKWSTRVNAPTSISVH
ncbi:hypothetical protein HGP17_09305 [Rhizobium sp. P38BS-XIX]|uniref:hypothetical protein n=1 Tax=Rhizobium sp. P38BS-XIX TaxID=2726740 RepID=UPI0014570038|nr:hypothetical protein [Rhizobium sp. P38BS-XIX]NLR97032.1 hypothetical protein [Rhizobium sp. P38BS-XIX]